MWCELRYAVKYLRETREKFACQPQILSCYEPSARYLINALWKNRRRGHGARSSGQ